jgi:protein gp37
VAENTKIEWCDSTFNPWVGCTKVSPACDFCYAEKWALRTGQAHLWAGERRRTTEQNWKLPLKWNRQAEAEGRRFRVFCASLADVFDNQVPSRWREDLWHLIDQTPHLDWLLLTKRPQMIERFLPDVRTGVKPWGLGWPNVWLGTTVENQEEAERRIPHLLAVPARVHFLSCEPLLGVVNLMNVRVGLNSPLHKTGLLAASHDHIAPLIWGTRPHRLGWVIAGGESGPGWRKTPDGAFDRLQADCERAGVAFFMKQLPNKAPFTHKPRREFPAQ